MPRKEILSAAEAAALIPDRAVVSISSSSGLCCPDEILKAIGRRYLETGRPRKITAFLPIAAGDMYGIGGIDHLCESGLLGRVIAGSLPSGPNSLPTPRVWKMIDNDEIEAYNIPSGILFAMLREAAARRPGVLTQVGVGTYVDPQLQGARMNRRTSTDLMRRVEFEGQDWLFFQSIPIDVAIIRATTADDSGNLSMEHEGAFLGALDQALAARANRGLVIAQVKRLASTGSIPPQQVRVPGTVVDVLVTAPEQMQTTQTDYDPAISGELRRPIESFAPVEWGTDKVIARRAAATLVEGETVILGFGISSLVPSIVLEEGQFGKVTWAIEQGAVGGMPLTGFQFGCAANPEAIVSSSDQFTFFHGGAFERCLLSFLQVDREGNVNVSRLRSLPHVTAGVGGFIDITSRAQRVVFSSYFTAGGLREEIRGGHLLIQQEGREKKFVPEVEHVTFSGIQARNKGQEVLFVTERCVLELGPKGLIVIEVAPGVDLERDILSQADFPLQVSGSLREMDRRLFDPQPIGLRLTRSATKRQAALVHE